MHWQTHLIELRKRLIYALIALALVFLLLLVFADHIFHFFALPLINALPHTGKIIATSVTAPVIVPLKLCFYLAGLIIIPFILYQFWMFIAPGLYQQERRLLWPALFVSSVLFYLGVAFAYFVTLPLVFKFFANNAPQDVTIMTDIGSLLSFIMKLFFAFGFAFEVPIIVLLLVFTGVVDYQQMLRARPYIIVVAFILGMLLTPPDVLSQVLLAIPIWLLYEIGLMFVKLLKPRLRKAHN